MTRSVSIFDHFAALSDPRQHWRVGLPLPEILLLVLCATLSGMEDFVEIRLRGEQRLEVLRRFLPYERGLPAHDTLNDVVNALDPDLFKRRFTTWVEALRDADPPPASPTSFARWSLKQLRPTSSRLTAGKGREPLQ